MLEDPKIYDAGREWDVHVENMPQFPGDKVGAPEVLEDTTHFFMKLKGERFLNLGYVDLGKGYCLTWKTTIIPMEFYAKSIELYKTTSAKGQQWKGKEFPPFVEFNNVHEQADLTLEEYFTNPLVRDSKQDLTDPVVQEHLNKTVVEMRMNITFGHGLAYVRLNTPYCDVSYTDYVVDKRITVMFNQDLSNVVAKLIATSSTFSLEHQEEMLEEMVKHLLQKKYFSMPKNVNCN